MAIFKQTRKYSIDLRCWSEQSKTKRSEWKKKCAEAIFFSFTNANLWPQMLVNYTKMSYVNKVENVNKQILKRSNKIKLN